MGGPGGAPIPMGLLPADQQPGASGRRHGGVTPLRPADPSRRHKLAMLPGGREQGWGQQGPAGVGRVGRAGPRAMGAQVAVALLPAPSSLFLAPGLPQRNLALHLPCPPCPLRHCPAACPSPPHPSPVLPAPALLSLPPLPCPRVPPSSGPASCGDRRPLILLGGLPVLGPRSQRSLSSSWPGPSPRQHRGRDAGPAGPQESTQPSSGFLRCKKVIVSS